MDQDAICCEGIGLEPGHIVLDGDPTPPTESGTATPYFSAHVCCGQTVAHLSNCRAVVLLFHKCKKLVANDDGLT